MASAAIMARLGLDISEFKGSLNSARAASDGFAKAASAAGGASSAMDDVWRSEHAVEHGAISMSDAIVSSQTGVEALGKSFELLHKQLNLGVRAAAGIAIFAKLLEAAVEKIGEVKKATMALRAEIDKPMYKAMGTGTEDAIRGVEALQEKIRGVEETLPKDNAKWDVFKTAFMDVVTLGSVSREMQKGVAAKKDAYDKIAERSAQIATNVREEGNARAEAAGSDRDVETLNARLAMEKKIASARISSLMPDAQMALIKDAEAEYSRVRDTIEYKFAAKKWELQLEHELLYLKLKGYDIDQRSAESRLNFAKAHLYLTRTVEGRQEAEAKVAAAAAAVDEEKKKTTELRAQQKLEREVAQFNGPDSARERLRMEGDLLQAQRRRTLATGDEAADLDVQIARKQQALRKFNQDQRIDGGKRREDADITSMSGLGEAEQIRLKQALLATARKYFEMLKATGTLDATQQAEAQAQLHGQKIEIDEIVRKRGESVAEARMETRIMEAELAGLTTLSKTLETKLSYEQKILQARRDGNKELERELTKRQQIAMGQQAQGLARERRDHVQLTLGELAADGTGSTGARARRAVREEERAKTRAKAGDLKGAQRHQNRADAIKRQLGTLKDSEKDLQAKFKGALDDSTVLKEIKANTDKLGKIL